MKSAEQLAEEMLDGFDGSQSFESMLAQAITAERERAKVLLEVCEWYGKAGPMELAMDAECVNQCGFSVMVGGKRARAALAKYKGEMG